RRRAHRVLLQARGEQVVEVGRPKRPARRTGAKSDALDAVRAAGQALIEDYPLSPCRRGDREGLRVLLATRHGACRAKVRAPQPAQGADRWGARGAAGRAAPAGQPTADRRLRGVEVIRAG
ncbi:MAG TPA: hypothetical protein VF468_20695, partial [Actinomycetota bacterium]|nr:hypothetical protein [Actinomycetota bacterium]